MSVSSDSRLQTGRKYAGKWMKGCQIGSPVCFWPSTSKGSLPYLLLSKGGGFSKRFR